MQCDASQGALRLAEELAHRFRSVRETTCSLAEPLSAEDCAVQSMPDASPTKWHLAHTTWFFETFILAAQNSEFLPLAPSFSAVFNSYYNSVGEQYPRAQRGLLTRPDLPTVLEYRTAVDEAILQGLESGSFRLDQLGIVELGIHHEQQHQELILTDVLHLLSQNPLYPAYRSDLPGAEPCEVPALHWYPGAEGIQSVGHSGLNFGFDNEGPRHKILLHPHEIGSRLVNNQEFRDFIDDDGYKRPELWLAEGWALKEEQGWEAPLYWIEGEGAWQHFSLAGLGALIPSEPVSHISYFEADAYAKWSDARLPLEGEWELTAHTPQAEDNLLESGIYCPTGVASAFSSAAAFTNATSTTAASTTATSTTAARITARPSQLFGDVWEWTSSAYQAYPGYRAGPGALGEYNGKFMANQYVLRGGSCVTPRQHIRSTYRNFFPAHARWQWSGLRLARDV
ncbi:MAG TPA: ergothioneine biosynthesis protein EgtB [Myxococcales bacterium]|nr:ergothioneine biosynthesis protein EgtB [Myxococcales bacterium]